MKSLKQMCLESFAGLYNNPGNDMTLGLMNHLTPVGNIATNVSNLFGAHLGIVAEVAEDQRSLKVYSSRFWTEKDMMNILRETVCGKTLYSYIVEQGLTAMAAMNIGQHYVAYFYAPDLAQNINGWKNPCAFCEESLDGETEIIYRNFSPINEAEEVDLEDEANLKRQDELLKLLNGEDKVATASELSRLYGEKYELPGTWNIRALRDEDGDLCVALRQDYKRETHKGKEADAKRSWVYVYGADPNSIWVPGLKNPSRLDDDVRKEIKSFLSWMKAEPTDKPHVFNLPGSKEFKKALREAEKAQKEAEAQQAQQNQPKEEPKEEPKKVNPGVEEIKNHHENNPAQVTIPKYN